MPYKTDVQRRLARAESSELVEVAAAISGWTLARTEFGSAANCSGIRTKDRTFSRRNDSRTIFATDERYGYGRKAGAFTGSDRTVISACRKVLRAAKIPAGEIDRIDSVSEMGQVAERVSEDEIRVGDPTVLRKLGRARRAVDGLPVWSSYAMVGLTEEGEVGWLELHWPEIPAPVLKEAGVLRSLVERGLEPPDLPLARPEVVEAGIIHSPAVGFSMDLMPVVRVIYLGDEPDVGRKATIYLDRHGDPVEPPRDIRPAEPSELERSYQEKSKGRAKAR